MKQKAVYTGWIGAKLEDRPLLEKMGFKLGRYDAPTMSFFDVEGDSKAVQKLKDDPVRRCFGLGIGKGKSLERQADKEPDLF